MIEVLVSMPWSLSLLVSQIDVWYSDVSDNTKQTCVRRSECIKKELRQEEHARGKRNINASESLLIKFCEAHVKIIHRDRADAELKTECRTSDGDT